MVDPPVLVVLRDSVDPEFGKLRVTNCRERPGS